MDPNGYPAGVLLDVWSEGVGASPSPFTNQVPPWMFAPPPVPPGAYLPGGQYQPTTIIIEPGGGRIPLTESDSAQRTISYADIYASQPAVSACVNRLVRHISTLPIKVMQWPAGARSQNGKPVFPEQVFDPEHSLVRLLHKPSPGYGHVSLMEWITMPLFTHGNSLIAKFRGNGPGEVPTQVIPLDWRYLSAWARIGQPVIVWSTVQTGVMKWIAPSETVFTAWNSPAGSQGAWLGVSPLQQLGVTIKIDEAAQRYAAAHFKNAARPSGMIVLPPEVNVRQNPQLTDQLQEKMQEAYGGVDQAFKTVVMGGGADWRPWGQTAEEAQLVQTRQWDLDEIAMVYDLDMDKGSSNSPERDAQFYKDLRPVLHMIRERLQSQLVDREPEWAAQRLFVELDLQQVTFSDPLALSDKVVREVEIGLISRDEGRVMLGYPARGGAADDLIYLSGAAGEVGDMPAHLAVTTQERENVDVTEPPGVQPQLEPINPTLGNPEGAK